MGTMATVDEVVKDEERILVSVRLRPLNDKEILRNDASDWECINDTTIIYKNVNLSVSERSMYPSAYTFGKFITKFNSSGLLESLVILHFQICFYFIWINCSLFSLIVM